MLLGKENAVKQRIGRTFKGLISVFLSVGMVCNGCFVQNVYADYDIGIYVDGKHLKTQVAPYIDSGGYLMLPVRTVYESLGAGIRYDSANKQILVFKNGDTISLFIGRKIAYINGSVIALNVEPQIKDGRTMVGLRDAANLLGKEVSWDPVYKRAYIGTDQVTYGDNDAGEHSFTDIKEGAWMDEWSQRASLRIRKTGADTAEVLISWSSGASEGSEWKFSCKWDAKNGVLRYENGELWDYYYYNGADDPIRELIYDDGSGSFTFDSVYLYWLDGKDDAGADCRFTYLS